MQETQNYAPEVIDGIDGIDGTKKALICCMSGNTSRAKIAIYKVYKLLYTDNYITLSGAQKRALAHNTKQLELSY